MLTLVEAGANINHNDGEILKLFINAGVGFADSIKNTILNHAELTEEMGIKTARAGLTRTIIQTLIEKLQLPIEIKRLTQKEKIQTLLMLIRDGAE